MTSEAPLPPQWCVRAIEEVADTYSGGTPKRSRSECFGGGIPWVKSGELNQGRIRATEETLSVVGLKSSSAQWVPASSALIAMYGATSGTVGFLEINATINQAVLAVIGKPGLAASEYLFHALAASTRKLLSRVQGSGQPNLNGKLIRSLLIPVPPLPEQRKIVAILSSVDDAIEKTQAVTDQVQVVKRGLILEHLCKVFPTRHDSPVPAGWRLLTLGTVAKVQGGFAFQSKTFGDSGVAVVRMTNLRDGSLSLANAVRVSPETVAELDRFRLRAGDLLLGLSGSLDNFAIVRTSDPPCYLNQRVGRFVQNDPSRLHYPFLRFLVQAPRFKQAVLRLAAGAAQLNVSPAQLGSIGLCLPTLVEQREIAETLSSLDDRLRKDVKTLAGQGRLKKALMAVLLTGELRVTPDTEVA